LVIANSGSVIAASGSQAILNNGNTVNGLINSGIIDGSNVDYGIANLKIGYIASITNNPSGSILSGYGGIFNDSSATIKNLTNSGIIDSFIPILNYGKMDNLSNDGVLRYSFAGKSVGIENDGSIQSLINGKMGSISARYNGLLNSSYIGAVLNSGSINLNTGSGGQAISNTGKIDLFNNESSGSIVAKGAVGIDNPNGLITELRNGGFIDVSGSSNGKGVLTGRSGIIETFTHTGSINASGGAVGIYNLGKINTLNNLQGAGSAYGALSLSKNLPLNYNIVINSNSNYGQLAVSQTSGTMNFGIYAGQASGVPASVVAPGTYSDVLQGFSSLSGVSGTSGSYGGLNYSLVADSIHSGMWDLVFTGTSSSSSTSTSSSSGLGIITGTGVNYQSLDLGVSVRPVMDGGTLKVVTPSNIAYTFTISPNGGVIDQNALNSTFSGGFESQAGSNGKLVIVNSGQAGLGSVTLSAPSTHTGGVQVNAGATLNITQGLALGSGPLDLIGSATVPATLGILQSTTIENPITVTGDPVFNVAQGEPSSVSNPISGTGDVVISGGGTLVLTAANTYSGPTTISNDGSTLSLSGSGSIANSSQLSNNGYFNITGKTGNVSLGGTFTQSASGLLAMNFSPVNNQQLNIAGSASLAGTLSLNAISGVYKTGRYTLLTANGLSGTFGTLSSNLPNYTNLGFTLAYDPSNVYLVLTPNLANTQSALQNIASSLQSIYTLQNSVLANSFNYDCNIFGENDVCVSAGGRNTAVSASNSLNNTSALLIASYRIHPQYRIGAYADQNLSVNNASSGVILGNHTPLIGIFGAWSERTDDLGAEVKVSAAFGQKNTTITRAVVGTSEAGSGSSQLNSQGAQAVAKYGFGVADATVLSPYLGIRYTQNNMSGYSEVASSAVTAPLTYSALNTNATSLLAGANATYKGIPQTTLYASAGLESDTSIHNGSLNASGIFGLTPINFNSNPVKNRPTASVGAYYDVEKNQRLGITGIYRQEPYSAAQTTSIMITYTVGL